MTDIDQLSGRELDARVAEQAFGWRLDPEQRDDDGAPFCLTPLPRFSENAGRARGAMFQVELRHPGAELSYAGESPFRAVVKTGSLIDQLNYIAYMGGQHHYLFDEENLVNTLKLSPFTEVKLRQFDPLVDLSERDFESIYALAIK